MAKTNTIIPLIIFMILSLAYGFKLAAQSYQLDQGCTSIGFDVERFMVGEVSGRFNEFSGKILLKNDDLNTLAVEVKKNANSLDSNNEIRNGHLKRSTWLDTEKYPEILFKSIVLIKLAEDNYSLSGELTIHGVTNIVSIPAKILSPFKDPTNKMSIGFKEDLEIDRFDYGITFNKKMGNGSFFIDNMVKIKIRALAYKTDWPKTKHLSTNQIQKFTIRYKSRFYQFRRI